MNKDLEETLNELGPDCRKVVDRLLAAREVVPRPAVHVPRFSNHEPRFASHEPRTTNHVLRAGYLVAASLFAAIALSMLFQRPADGACDVRSAYTVAYARDAASLAAIVASQRSDGSWANDWITRQNAAALRDAQSDEMRVAYRKAVRYLRSKGLAPLTGEELRARGETAAAWRRG